MEYLNISKGDDYLGSRSADSSRIKMETIDVFPSDIMSNSFARMKYSSSEAPDDDPLEQIFRMTTWEKRKISFEQLLTKRNIKGEVSIDPERTFFVNYGNALDTFIAPSAGPHVNSYIFLDVLASIQEELAIIYRYIVEDYPNNTAFNMTVREAEEALNTVYDILRHRDHDESFESASTCLGDLGVTFKNALIMLIAVDSPVVNMMFTPRWVKYIPGDVQRYNLLIKNLNMYLKAKKNKVIFYTNYLYSKEVFKQSKFQLTKTVNRLAKTDDGSKLIGFWAYYIRVRPILEGFTKAYPFDPENIFMAPLDIPPYYQERIPDKSLLITSAMWKYDKDLDEYIIEK